MLAQRSTNFDRIGILELGASGDVNKQSLPVANLQLLVDSQHVLVYLRLGQVVLEDLERVGVVDVLMQRLDLRLDVGDDFVVLVTGDVENVALLDASRRPHRHPVVVHLDGDHLRSELEVERLAAAVLRLAVVLREQHDDGAGAFDAIAEDGGHVDVIRRQHAVLATGRHPAEPRAGAAAVLADGEVERGRPRRPRRTRHALSQRHVLERERRARRFRQRRVGRARRQRLLLLQRFQNAEVVVGGERRHRGHWGHWSHRRHRRLKSVPREAIASKCQISRAPDFEVGGRQLLSQLLHQLLLLRMGADDDRLLLRLLHRCQR